MGKLKKVMIFLFCSAGLVVVYAILATAFYLSILSPAERVATTDVVPRSSQIFYYVMLAPFAILFWWRSHGDLRRRFSYFFIASTVGGISEFLIRPWLISIFVTDITDLAAAFQRALDTQGIGVIVAAFVSVLLMVTAPASNEGKRRS